MLTDEDRDRDGYFRPGRERRGDDLGALGRHDVTARWGRGGRQHSNDPRSPFVTSGIRVGTPAITTRGFGEAESVQLTNWICDIFDALESGNADDVIASVKTKVSSLCKDFPVYAE